VTPGGWQPDPNDPAVDRWWNGQAWTEHTRRRPDEGVGSPRRRRSSRRLLFAGIALVALLALLLVPKLVRSFTGSIHGANAYMGDVKAGRTLRAYRRLCTELTAQNSYEAYRDRLRAEESQGGALQSFNAHSTNSEVGSNVAYVLIDVRTTHGRGAIEARMVHEGQQWLWCGSRPAPKSVGINIRLF
jgi:hypothetical protein